MGWPDITETTSLFLVGRKTREVVLLQDQDGCQCLYVNGRIRWNKVEEDHLPGSELIEIVGDRECSLDYCSFKGVFNGNPPEDLGEANDAGLID